MGANRSRRGSWLPVLSLHVEIAFSCFVVGLCGLGRLPALGCRSIRGVTAEPGDSGSSEKRSRRPLVKFFFPRRANPSSCRTIFVQHPPDSPARAGFRMTDSLQLPKGLLEGDLADPRDKQNKTRNKRSPAVGPKGKGSGPHTARWGNHIFIRRPGGRTRTFTAPAGGFCHISSNLKATRTNGDQRGAAARFVRFRSPRPPRRTVGGEPGGQKDHSRREFFWKARGHG